MLMTTILAKLRIIFLIIIMFFLGYIVTSYQLRKDTNADITDIVSNKSKMAFIHGENFPLLEGIIYIFYDAYMVGEVDRLSDVELNKRQIIVNLNKLKKYSNDEKITLQLDLLNNFLVDSTEDINHYILSEKPPSAEMSKRQHNRNNRILSLYKKQKDSSQSALTNSLEKVSEYTNEFFYTSLWLSIFGLLVMIVTAFYLHNTIKRRFEQVTNSLDNLIKKRPDFSKKIDVGADDEIGRLITGFNMLQSKLEVNYNQMNELKIKAEDNANLKSEFLANMSHEIRTPMNGIVGMSYLVLQSDLNKKQRGYIEKIDNSAKMLLSIINDVLDLSKIESGKFIIDKVDFNVHKMIDRTIDLIRFKAKEKRLKLSVLYSKDIPERLHGDSLRISQVLINLLGNAVKFTSDGEISLFISRVKENRFRFEVRDTGVGLTEDEQKKLFKAFSQADGSTTRNFGGTGLGLIISKQLVELMNGKIWVESQHGIGSSFIFDIELLGIQNSIKNKKQENNRVRVESDLQKSMNSLKGSKILLVDDNSINQEIIIGLLENYSIELDIASNGQEGVEMFENNNYSLILMDLQMPIMDGYEATKLIREQNNKIPIIAITANAMKEDIEKTAKSGMNAHLNKPIEVEKLFHTLLKYIPLNAEGNKVAESITFNNLEKAIKSRRPKNCSSAIEDLEKISLSPEEQEIFTEVKKLISEYKFSLALNKLS